MILGIGTDIVEIDRIARMLGRYGRRFEMRCFTAAEQERAATIKSFQGKAASYAKRFAAKEACVKALGTGFVQGIFMTDIGIEDGGGGQPVLVLRGGAQKRLMAMLPQGRKPALHVSLSDEKMFAQAFVVLEGVKE